METRLTCKILLLWLFAGRALGSNDSSLDLARDYDVRSLSTERIEPATTQTTSRRQSRWQRPGEADYARVAPEYQDDEDILPEDHHHPDHHEEESVDTKAMSEAKTDYWGGYYDFLINEGSYKFWAVFQLATAALLIYSGFAALYYAKVNPMYSDDYDELFARRRRRSVGQLRPPRERPFLGFQPRSFQRILDAVARELH